MPVPPPAPMALTPYSSRPCPVPLPPGPVSQQRQLHSATLAVGTGSVGLSDPALCSFLIEGIKPGVALSFLCQQTNGSPKLSGRMAQEERRARPSPALEREPRPRHAQTVSQKQGLKAPSSATFLAQSGAGIPTHADEQSSSKPARLGWAGPWATAVLQSREVGPLLPAPPRAPQPAVQAPGVR